MPSLRPRGSSVFSGLVLIFIGLLLLLHNYRGFELSGIIIRWWPLILIFWGAIKIYERTAGARGTQPGASRIISRGMKHLPAALMWRQRPCPRMRALRCAGDGATLSYELLMSERFAYPAKL